MLNSLESLTALLLERHLQIATAESCTAGLVAKLLTDQAGSSQWFERGFVTYSNDAKQEMLGVSGKILAQHGAVSEQTVKAMASGALAHSRANVALAISGIAGPTGGTPDKPVGTVCFAWADDAGRVQPVTQHFTGDRAAIREQAAAFAIAGMLEFLHG